MISITKKPRIILILGESFDSQADQQADIITTHTLGSPTSENEMISVQ